ncbi:hypothetical protein MMC10_002786 [Thelotrema lepadinum]|nr:hypothetical protein [Thelotrema lepadinum]
MPSKPTIAFVPGAWFLPIQYKELTDLLEAAGYETIIQKNPSCDSADPFNADTQADADAVRNNVLLPLIAAGKEVVLIAHSYGGSPAAAAATGLSKGDMSAMGGAGGIIGLIWVAAFIAQEGESLQSKLPGGKLEPWHVEHQSEGQLSVLDPKHRFLADVPSPTDQLAISQLRFQSKASFTTPSAFPAWLDSYYDGRRSYFNTLQDEAIIPIAQEMMIKGSGVPWNVKSSNSSHSPFLSRPKELSAWIIEQVAAFATEMAPKSGRTR